MKTAIITLSNNGNYGASLQAYALNRVVRSLGHDCDTIQYRRALQNRPSVPQKFLAACQTIRFTPTALLDIPARLVMNRLLKTRHLQRQARFAAFEAENIPRTERMHCGSADAASLTQRYDAFICGSDNIWNRAAFDPAMALDFVHGEKLKFSYAAGFSTDALSSKEQASMIAPISKLDAISVRESNGQALLERLLGRPVALSPDPTLLLTKQQWLEVAKPVSGLPEKYIFCYFQGRDGRFREYARRLSKRLAIPIVSMPHMYNYTWADRRFGDQCLFVGPSEFIACVAGAQYVCTDTFHGSIFATLFEKPFLAFNRFHASSQIGLNFRLVNLFRLLGMPSSVVTDDDAYERVLSQPVDYGAVAERLRDLRAEAENYLTQTFALARRKPEQGHARATANTGAQAGAASE